MVKLNVQELRQKYKGKREDKPRSTKGRGSQAKKYKGKREEKPEVQELN